MNELDQLIFGAESKRATDIIIQDGRRAYVRVNRRISAFDDFILPPAGELLKQILERFPEETRRRYGEDLRCMRDVDCAFDSQSKTRVRVNIFTTVGGLQFALRLIPKERMSAERIGIPAAVLDALRAQSGLFLVTGISGSGKTTTLAAILDVMNATEQKHILTIEDPIEYVFENKGCLFSQREIPTHARDYAGALRSAVRENADVVLIGEMRDYPTVKAAIELAETGHLVLSTLHTRNSVSTIDRILSMTTTQEQAQMRAMLSTQLIGVLSQSILRRKSGGLIASFEFMKATSAIRNQIREDKLPMIYSEIQTGAREGMTTMEDYLARLVGRGLITAEDAMRGTSKPDVLARILSGARDVGV